ncbi:MAG: DUF3943 domain-containing protein [Ignavibacteriota bacterium]
MKIYIVVFVALLIPNLILAQGGQPDPSAEKVRVVPQDTNIKALKVPVDTNSKKILVKDTSAHVENQYHGLLNDDPIYNKKEPFTTPMLKVLLENASLLAVDRYILNYDFSRVGFNSWSHNLKSGWEWDNDRFAVNFFLHPYTGGNYFIAGRSSGFTFWESIPFALEGSLTWEYFGETTLPSYNDVVNTTLNGAFGGEVLFRLTSNILDDRTTGSERFGRELAAGILSPMRFFSRLVQGKVGTVTTAEVYQKEPLDVVLSGGVRSVNAGPTVGAASLAGLFNFDFDYGDPFEKRDRKPFDYFVLRNNLSFGAGRKIVDNVVGTAFLYGKNIKMGSLETLTGFYQNYELWDNQDFELGALGFTAGIVSKIGLAKNTNLYTNFQIGLIPLAGNSNERGPDTTQVRDYYYSAGSLAKLDATVNVSGIFSVTVLAYLYGLHTLIGTSGNNLIAIIKPRLEVRVYDNIGIGVEHLIYSDTRYTAATSGNRSSSEDKVFLTVYLADFLNNK